VRGGKAASRGLREPGRILSPRESPGPCGLNRFAPARPSASWNERGSCCDGSHARYLHLDGRAATVPMHPGDVPVPVIRSILGQVGHSEDEWERL
jgi:hypothetical protein